MGFLNKVFRAVAAPVKQVVKAAGNTVSKTVQGDISGAGKSLLGGINTVADTYANVLTGGTVRFKDGKLGADLSNNWTLKAATDGIGQISGATAMKKEMEAQAARDAAAARQQAITSDALANEASTRDSAQIGLGRRKKSNKVSNSAGLGGVSQGSGTGVQS